LIRLPVWLGGDKDDVSAFRAYSAVDLALHCLVKYWPGELFNIRIGGLQFEDDFVRVDTTGKTGPKRLALVTSFVPIKEWLAEHPQSDDPNAFLWYHNNKQGVMAYQMLFHLIKKSAKMAGIKKRVWVYLFRHTSLTMYSKKLGNLVKLYGNWSAGSNMLRMFTCRMLPRVS
jgi:hypothetical protein